MRVAFDNGVGKTDFVSHQNPQRKQHKDQLHSWDFKLEPLITICSSSIYSTSLDKTQGPIYDYGPLSLQHLMT